MMDFASGGLGPTQCCADVQCERGHAEGAGQGVYGLAGEAVGDHGAHILGLAGGTGYGGHCPAGKNHHGLAQGAGNDNLGSAVDAGHDDN